MRKPKILYRKQKRRQEKIILKAEKRKGGKICEKENFMYPANAVFYIYRMRRRERRKHREYG
jgi:hypothetical protein